MEMHFQAARIWDRLPELSIMLVSGPLADDGPQSSYSSGSQPCLAVTIPKPRGKAGFVFPPCSPTQAPVSQPGPNSHTYPPRRTATWVCTALSVNISRLSGGREHVGGLHCEVLDTMLASRKGTRVSWMLHFQPRNQLAHLEKQQKTHPTCASACM